jgi:hypothetical protein
MPIPTATDRFLREIDDIHAGIMVRMQTFLHNQNERNQKNVVDFLREYVDKVQDFLSAPQNCG